MKFSLRNGIILLCFGVAFISSSTIVALLGRPIVTEQYRFTSLGVQYYYTVFDLWGLVSMILLILGLVLTIAGLLVVVLPSRKDKYVGD